MGSQAKQRVVLVAHDTMGRDDRASQFLLRRGYEVEWYYPAEGESLPAADERYVATIVYGGVESVNDWTTLGYLKDEIDWIARWLDSGRPFVGFCLGGQLLAHALGARVEPHAEGLHEWGFYAVQPTAAGREIFDGPMHLYQAHKEGFDVPTDAVLLAEGDNYPHQAFRHGDKSFGFQFHPEVTLPIMHRWLDSYMDHDKSPGIHSRARQVDDFARYGEPMGQWLERFLDLWLSDGDAAKQEQPKQVSGHKA